MSKAYPPHAGDPHGHAQHSQTSTKAILSLILGLMSFFCVFFTGLPAIILGAMGLSDIGKSRGRLTGQPMAIIGLVTGVLGCMWTLIMVGMLLPAVQQVREAARATQTMNSVRQLTLAAHNYEASYQHFPVADGDPERGDGSMLSWRVKLLPYIDEQELYDQFHHNEPWDSPHNQSLIGQMPAIFTSPSANFLEEGKTLFVVATPRPGADLSEKTIFTPGETVSFPEITDGSSNTAFIFEVNEEAAVTWTQPKDWEFDPLDPHRDLGGVHPGNFIVSFADGSTTRISNSIPPESLRYLFSRGDGQIVDFMQY